MRFLKCFPFLLFSFVTAQLMAQPDIPARKFRLGAVAGLNASQLDGDNFRGYSKLGLHVGLRVNYPINDRVGLNLEMLYSMKGSSKDLDFSSSDNEQIKIKLNYVEIPFLVGYKEWNMDFRAGVVFSRLLNASSSVLTTPYVQEDFSRLDVGILIGAAYQINNNWGGCLFWGRSMKNALREDVNGRALFGHWLTFRLEYLF